MARQVLLVSRDLAWAGALATSWAAAGDTVSVVLLDEAVAAVRSGHRSAGILGEVLAAGAFVAVHDEALGRRGIVPDAVLAGVKAADLDEIADLIGDGADRVVWL
jgi:hypothetical protein